MKTFIKKYSLTLVGILFGALAGYFYWQQIGCNSGTCTITSNPRNSTIYGAIMGGLLFSIFQKSNQKKSTKATNTTTNSKLND